MINKISLKQVNRPKKRGVKEDTMWIFDSLCLVSGRDTESMSFKVFYEFLKELHKSDSVSSEIIADRLKVGTGKVNHHVRALADSGVVYREKRKVVLRGGSLSSAIEEIRRDVGVMFDKIEEVAEELDKTFKLR